MSEKQRAHLERARRRNRRCAGRRRDGAACGMPAMRGSRYCLQHDDTELGELARASQGRKAATSSTPTDTDVRVSGSTGPPGSGEGPTDASSQAPGRSDSCCRPSQRLGAGRQTTAAQHTGQDAGLGLGQRQSCLPANTGKKVGHAYLAPYAPPTSRPAELQTRPPDQNPEPGTTLETKCEGACIQAPRCDHHMAPLGSGRRINSL
jgi:hypothetical protein